MNLRFALVLVVGLLLTSSTDARKKKGKGSEDDGDSTAITVATTPAETTSEASIATSVSVESSPVTVNGGSTAAPVTGETTVATTVNGGTTAAPVTGETTAATTVDGGSTAAPVTGETTAATVTSGTTETPGPTTTAPLPNVTVSILQFAPATCDSTSCTYEFNAPGNDQVFLATENSLIDADRNEYNALQTDADAKDTDIKQANKEAEDKMKELQTLLDQIQTNLDKIQANIVAIQSSQADAQNTLYYVEQFVADVNSAPNTCLYQRCLAPTTPVPSTTTPTPSPTTPPSPCLNFTCPDDPTGDKSCVLDNSNLPYCTNCGDNYNGYNHCDSIACSASGTNLTFADNGNGNIFSTGYNKSSPSDSLIPANANCRWQLYGSNFSVLKGSDSYNLTCLASGSVTITVWGDDGSKQVLTSTTTARSINAFLGIVDNPYFVLTSTKAEQSYCQIPVFKSSGQMLAEEKKSNGFFSWLMGN